MDKNNNFSITTIIFIVVAAILLIFHFIFQSRIDDMVSNEYMMSSKKMRNTAKTLISEKMNATLTISMTLAQNNKIKEAFLKNDFSDIDLHDFSLKLKENSDFKNVWFQIISAKGISKYRSWTDKRGDSLLDVRLDISQMIKEPKIMSIISTGKFDMTFKSMVPIAYEGELLGIIETITHFNSIATLLSKGGIDAVILVDKSYKKQLTEPFTKLFIKDYYVANINAKKPLMGYIEENGIEKFINLRDGFIVDEERIKKLIAVYELPDILGNKMGYVILFKELSSINMSEIKNTKILFIVLSVAALIAFGIIMYMLINRQYASKVKQHNEQLKKLNDTLNIKIQEVDIEREKNRNILNFLPNIVMLIDENEVRDVNRSFFKLFNQYNSLEEFKKEHSCICSLFKAPPAKLNNYIDTDTYLTPDEDRKIKGIYWLEYLLKNKDKSAKVFIKSEDKEHHFLIDVQETNIKKGGGKRMAVINFTEITDEVELDLNLKKKEKLLSQQSKMAAMGEMIANIAHQWRQP